MNLFEMAGCFWDNESGPSEVHKRILENTMYFHTFHIPVQMVRLCAWNS